MIETIFVIANKVGLHARPAALFVQTAKKYSADITVSNVTGGGKSANAKSIISVLTLGVQQGHQIKIQVNGEDEETALKDLQELIENNFGEA